MEVEELEDFTLQMAHHISEKAPLAIAVIKEELRVLGEAHTMNSDEFERIQGMRRAVYDSEDYREGMNAFLENVNLISLVINPCERRSKNGNSVDKDDRQ